VANLSAGWREPKVGALGRGVVCSQAEKPSMITLARFKGVDSYCRVSLKVFDWVSGKACAMGCGHCRT
jgi:hypothetical protein